MLLGVTSYIGIACIVYVMAIVPTHTSPVLRARKLSLETATRLVQQSETGWGTRKRTEGRAPGNQSSGSARGSSQKRVAADVDHSHVDQGRRDARPPLPPLRAPSPNGSAPFCSFSGRKPESSSPQVSLRTHPEGEDEGAGGGSHDAPPLVGHRLCVRRRPQTNVTMSAAPHPAARCPGSRRHTAVVAWARADSRGFLALPPRS